jgi:lysozyme
MKINQAGIDLIKQFEGFRATTYLDVGGKPTIGYGHLLRKGETYGSVSESQAQDMLRADVAEAESAVLRNVPAAAALTTNQFSALVCWVYNLGEGNLRGSALLAALNAGRFDDVPAEMLRWHRDGKAPIAGLIKRRAAEACLFLSNQNR